MMVTLKELSIPILISLGINDSPLYDFRYLATTEYGERQVISGTHFYEPVLPEINAQFYFTHGKRFSYVVGINSGFKSEKYTRAPNVSAKIFYDVVKNEDFTFTLFSTVSVGGGVRETPCIDSLNREFHCYWGTNVNSALFFMPYNEVTKITSRRSSAEIKDIGVSLVWNF